MCRWLAYSGSPVLLEELLVKPVHSLIDQSLHSRLGATTKTATASESAGTAAAEAPGVFRSIEPAWNDRNLREQSTAHIESPVVFAHIRASSGSGDPADQLLPPPSRPLTLDAQGVVRELPRVKRDLVLAVSPSFYPHIEGSTDSEGVLLPRAQPRAGGRPTRARSRGRWA